MRVRGTSGQVVVDDGHPPFLFVTWFDAADEVIVDGYFEEYCRVVDETHARGGKLVLVSDGLDASPPGAVIRRRIMAKSDAMPAYLSTVQVANFVVLANPLLRGALTAMSWLSKGQWASVYVGTLTEAIERGRVALREAGVDTPDTAAQVYRRPSR